MPSTKKFPHDFLSASKCKKMEDDQSTNHSHQNNESMDIK
jgi:hypothetical protein